MQNQPVVCVHQILRWDTLEQCQLHRQRIFSRCQAGAVADAKDVGINRHRRLTKGHVEHHVGGLSADAGQGDQGLAAARHLAAVLLDQDATRLQQVFCFIAEKAYGFDVLGDFLQPQVQHFLRRVRLSKQALCGLVHAHIGGLR